MTIREQLEALEDQLNDISDDLSELSQAEIFDEIEWSLTNLAQAREAGNRELAKEYFEGLLEELKQLIKMRTTAEGLHTKLMEAIFILQ